MTIGIAYETPREKIEQIAGIIEAVIRAQPGIRFERCHFKELGAYALNFEAVFFVLQPKLDALMDAQHDINLGTPACVRITRDRVCVSDPEAAARAGRQADGRLAGRGGLTRRGEPRPCR